MSKSFSHRVDALLNSMSLDEQIGQICQIDLNMLLDNDEGEDKDQAKPNSCVNVTKLEYYVGQMGVGSVFNNVVGSLWNASQFRSVIVQMQNIAKEHNRPPIVYGLDSIHGANYIQGATLFPQPLNIAATFNQSMAYQTGKIASRDTRAAGISWIFSPLVGVALNPRWSRIYETFGEDMLLVGTMAKAMIQGIQQYTPNTNNKNKSSEIPSRAAAAAKHFIGYSSPRTGHDRSPSWIPTRHLYQYFVPPWRHVTDEAFTVMESYTEVNGVPIVANALILQTLLRFQLQFNGMLVTDYQEIWNQVDWHLVANSRSDAVAASITAGVDMSMVPFDVEGFRQAIKDAIASKHLDEKHIRNAAGRVLALKEKLNMLDEVLLPQDVNLGKVGTDREEAIEMARQSIVLVKNKDNILPLSSKEKLKVLVTGPTANSLSFQTGGWTWQWQGADNDSWFSYGTTVLNATQQLPWLVTYGCGTDIMGLDCDQNNSPGVVDTVESWVGWGGDIPMSIKSAAEQDVEYVVVCVGEENYAEKPGDIDDLELPDGQKLLVQQLASNSKNKVILVYFGGRPRIMREMEPLVDAILVAFLPGPDAGKAVIEIISGLTNPSGRLPITYPKHEDLQGIPYFHAVSEQCTRGSGPLPHFQYGLCDIQWPFGFGLSYTSFEYSDLKVNSNTIQYAAGQSSMYRRGVDSLVVTVVVTNTGSLGGHETVMFFSFDEYRSVTPEYKRLRSFEKIFLAPGESKTVTATISPNDIKFIGAEDDSHLILEDGMVFRIGIGASTDCRASSEESLCSGPITVLTGQDYIGACDAACDVWEMSACLVTMNARQCYSMCSAASDDDLVKNGWGWPYVNCIESVAAQNILQDMDQCSKMTSKCRDVFQSRSPTPLMPSHTSLWLGVGTGTLAACLIALAVRGDLFRLFSRCRRDPGESNVLFARVTEADID